MAWLSCIREDSAVAMSKRHFFHNVSKNHLFDLPKSGKFKSSENLFQTLFLNIITPLSVCSTLYGEQFPEPKRVQCSYAQKLKDGAVPTYSVVYGPQLKYILLFIVAVSINSSKL